MEEQTVCVSEHVTEEAVACRLASIPPVDPLIYVQSREEFSSQTSLTSYVIGLRLPSNQGLVPFFVYVRSYIRNIKHSTCKTMHYFYIATPDKEF